MKALILALRYTTAQQIQNAVLESGFQISRVFTSIPRTDIDEPAIDWANEFNVPPLLIQKRKTHHNFFVDEINHIEKVINKADCLVTVWDGRHPRIDHAVNYARMKHKPFYIQLQLQERDQT